MPAWWDSLETVTTISGYAKTIGFILGVLTALCGAVIFFSGRQVDSLKAKRDAARHLSKTQKEELVRILATGPKGKFTVASTFGPADADEFAAEIGQAMLDAGWTGTKSVSIFTFKGLKITSGMAEDTRARAVFLLEALKAIGLTPELEAKSDVPADEIFVVIGSKQ